MVLQLRKKHLIIVVNIRLGGMINRHLGNLSLLVRRVETSKKVQICYTPLDYVLRLSMLHVEDLFGVKKTSTYTDICVYIH
jgi:hypothetical protein